MSSQWTCATCRSQASITFMGIYSHLRAFHGDWKGSFSVKCAHDGATLYETPAMKDMDDFVILNNGLAAATVPTIEAHPCGFQTLQCIPKCVQNKK
jgi:hypothetical protein